MQHATLAARSFGVMEQAESAVRIILKYLHATEQHSACRPKLRYPVRSLANASSGVSYRRKF